MVMKRTSPSVSFASLRFSGFTRLAFAAVLSRWTTSRRALLFLRRTWLFRLRLWLRLRPWLCGRTAHALGLRALLLRRRRTLGLRSLLHRTRCTFSLWALLLRWRRTLGLWPLLHWTCD